jgi:hypothetical protein
MVVLSHLYTPREVLPNETNGAARRINSNYRSKLMLIVIRPDERHAPERGGSRCARHYCDFPHFQA